MTAALIPNRSLAAAAIEFSSSSARRADSMPRAEAGELPLAEDLPCAGRFASTVDQRLIARVLAGDEEAAGVLFKRLYPLVMKLIRCRLPRRTAEEDLAQTVFVKIFTKLHQFSGEVPLEHWVSRITLNTCFSQLTAEKVRPELRMCDLPETEHIVIEKLLATNDDLPGSDYKTAHEIVAKMLERLSSDERLVVSLLHLEEKSVKEISSITGWSVALVKVRAFRARRRMRTLLHELLASERGLTAGRC